MPANDPVFEQILREVKKNHGFLNEYQIGYISAVDPFRKVLVRTNMGRFTTAIQNVMWYKGIITREGSDYVRDISLPDTDPVFNGVFGRVTQG